MRNSRRGLTAAELVIVLGSLAALGGVSTALVAAVRNEGKPGAAPTTPTIPVDSASAESAASAATSNWAPITGVPSAFQISISGHPDASLNGLAILPLSQAAPPASNWPHIYGVLRNGRQLVICLYDKPGGQTNRLDFNAMVLGQSNFHFIAVAGTSPPQTGTFQLFGQGQIDIAAVP